MNSLITIPESIALTTTPRGHPSLMSARPKCQRCLLKLPEVQALTHGRIFFLTYYIIFFFLDLSKMDQMTNNEFFQIFKDYRKNCFDKEPNFDHILQKACGWHKKMCLSNTKIIWVKIDPLLVLAEQWKRMFAYYVKKFKRPLDELGDWQQRHCLSDYITTTTAKVHKENVSPSKLFAFGLKKKYLQNKEVSKIDKSIFQDKDGAISPQQHITFASCISNIWKWEDVKSHIHRHLSMIERSWC